jgi:hypothetical protein
MLGKEFLGLDYGVSVDTRLLLVVLTLNRFTSLSVQWLYGAYMVFVKLDPSKAFIGILSIRSALIHAVTSPKLMACAVEMIQFRKRTTNLFAQVHNTMPRTHSHLGCLRSSSATQVRLETPTAMRHFLSLAEHSNFWPATRRTSLYGLGMNFFFVFPCSYAMVQHLPPPCRDNTDHDVFNQELEVLLFSDIHLPCEDTDGYAQYNLQLIYNTTQLLRKYLPSVRIFPILGNHDYYPVSGMCMRVHYDIPNNYLLCSI